MKINCAIIDEQQESVDIIREYVAKIPYLNLIGSYTEASEALKGFRSHTIDLLFSGIRMPQLSGLEFAKILPKKTKIVFITAFSEYALDGYKSGAFDYLLKPVSYENFEACVERVKSYMCDVEGADPIRRDGYMFVKNDGKHIRVRLDDILFIEGVKDYVKFHMRDKHNILTLLNLHQLEVHLPQTKFQRIHRSFIANLEQFDYTDKAKLYYGDESIPISDSYRNVLQEYIDKHSL